MENALYIAIIRWFQAVEGMLVGMTGNIPVVLIVHITSFIQMDEISIRVEVKHCMDRGKSPI